MDFFEGHAELIRQQTNPVLYNPYVRGLSIYDHLNECLLLANEIKIKKNSVEGYSDTLKTIQEHYRKELTDLYILIGKELSYEEIEERYKKFQQKYEEGLDECMATV